jgi:hypothetical protein
MFTEDEHLNLPFHFIVGRIACYKLKEAKFHMQCSIDAGENIPDSLSYFLKRGTILANGYSFLQALFTYLPTDKQFAHDK